MSVFYCAPIYGAEPITTDLVVAPICISAVVDTLFVDGGVTKGLIASTQQFLFIGKEVDEQAHMYIIVPESNICIGNGIQNKFIAII